MTITTDDFDDAPDVDGVIPGASGGGDVAEMQSQTSHVNKGVNKRKSKHDDIAEMQTKVNKAINDVAQVNEYGPTEMFLLSLAPMLASLSPERKEFAKIQL